MSAQIDWGIGTKWTWNTLDYDSIIGKVVHKPLHYEITDTTMVNGQFCYLLSDGGVSPYYLYWTENEVYFFNNYMEDFVLGYSFKNDSNFTSTQWVKLSLQSPYQRIDYQVTIDTSYQEVINGNVINVSEYTYEESDSLLWIPSPKIVYENIGFKSYSFLPYDIAPITIGTFAFDNIRCFENQGRIFNFQNYPCDSIFGLTTNVINQNAEKLAVSPNPNNGSFQIPDFKEDDAVQLIDPAGRQIHFIQKENQFSLDQPYHGWAWVRLVRENRIYGAKIYIH